MKTINYGIIGCGLIADWHAQSVKILEKTKPVKLYAVTDTVAERAKTFADKYGIKVFASVEEMLSSPEIDVVSICTPSGFHSSLACDAARHGKNIVVEKPMAITKEQLDEVEKTCDRYNVKLSSISQLRYENGIVKTREAIISGKLGKMVCGDVYMKMYRSKEYYANGGWRGTIKLDGGGALMNQGIHGVDLLQYIMGPVKSVYAKCKTLVHSIEVEDTAIALIEYESGALGTIEATTSVYPGYAKRFEFHGEKGTIKLEETSFLEWNIEGEEKPEDIEIVGSTTHNSANRPDGIALDGHILQIGDMIDALTENRAPFIDQHEGRKPVDIILAIYESSASGKPVDLAEFVKR